ncbi:MAG: hypothetical protein SFU27_09660 [Thermonemataceae bacterium]|nr:hypothetical protein [Thermonemataceae bacterium]
MKKILFSIVLFLFLHATSFAQCVMCKSVAESNTKGESINSAILYMAFFPYLLLSVLGYIWYKNYKKQKNEKKNKVASHRSL